MQQRPFDAICIGDEAPSPSHTIVRAFVQNLPEYSCPNDVHHNREGPEGMVCY